jgi:hypothetical protein
MRLPTHDGVAEVCLGAGRGGCPLEFCKMEEGGGVGCPLEFCKMEEGGCDCGYGRCFCSDKRGSLEQMGCCVAVGLLLLLQFV